jgi:chemotaxis signal transduction protein
MTRTQDVRDSFVLVRIGDRRFAVAAGVVAELSPPVRLHTFPHTTAPVSGVIVRRGKIIPVCNAGAVVGGKRSSANLFYLVAEYSIAGSAELLAIPVNGESELVSGEMQPRDASAPSYISGTLPAGADSIGVLDLSVLAGTLRQTSASSTSEVPS